MFSFFERLLKPFPEAPVGPPPATLFAFCWHYTRSAKRYLLAMAAISAMIALIEVSLFGALGSLVD